MDERIILHVDMDAFYASIEMRDNPFLKGLPLIIGAKPEERGVVSTCNYEARKYGVHSGMNIKDAFRLCPDGIYLHPDFRKYKRVSSQLHSIWESYTDKIEYIAFDEAFLDLTGKVSSIDDARIIASDLKKKVLDETNLTCSVGLGYSKSSAKLSSEEKKPNGYFEILTKSDFLSLVDDRAVRVLPFIGPKTEEKLNLLGIFKVRDIRDNSDVILQNFKKQADWIISVANGVDEREITPYSISDMKSLGREVTFQLDTKDRELLNNILFLLSLATFGRLKALGMKCKGVSVKATFYDMKKVTRQKKCESLDSVFDVYTEATHLLEKIDEFPIRLIGVRLYDIEKDDSNFLEKDLYVGSVMNLFSKLSERYNYDFFKNRNAVYDGEGLHALSEYMRKYEIYLQSKSKN